MVWSLTKVLLFLLVVAGLTLATNYLLHSPEGARIAISHWEFTLGPVQGVIVLLLLMAALWLLLKLIGLAIATYHFLNGDETAISRYFDRNREQKGYKALSDGMMALAAGDGRLALLRARRAEKYLSSPELTTLLVAQAAEAAGDTARATEAYRALLADEATRFVGLRGLIKQKLAEGDTDTALKLAEKAFGMRPKHAETQDILLKLQSENSDWTGARATLGAKVKAGGMPKDVYRRRDAILALQEAKGVIDDTASIDAREAAIEANRLSPDLIPAAVMAAQMMIERGDRRSAARVLKKAWEAQPHPELAAAFATIDPDETPHDRLKRFQALTLVHPEQDETKLLLAELNIAAEEYPEARRAMGDIVTRHPTQRALAIMAAIERGQGSDEAVVRGWLAKALIAPRGPQWCCDKCQAIHSQWAPICDNCGGFDTLSWREPTETAGRSATESELLPILVASPSVSAVAPEQKADLKAGIETSPEIIDLAAVARSAN